ncbi:ERF family protein, partial [Streptococcus pseudopneumoniae]|uniref:ERF family protein n=1 Tax=Streptococcus pseudopneumoniae TaxID=257758 RepID=UPI0018B0DFA0
VLKNANNPHLKSKYADLGSVLDACQSALHDNGFAIMQPCGKDQEGAFVETVLAHESGESFASRVYLVVGKQDMQGVGSAITYARRYGLLG